MNAYEIRYNLLCRAKEALYENWHAAIETERRQAEYEERAVKVIAAPTIEDIKTLAESFYDFVAPK